jgi:DNA helicase IV
MKIELKDLELKVKQAQAALDEAVKTLEEAKSLPENNVFDDLEFASAKIEDTLLDKASEDCEGAYNCGLEQYTQLFYVQGELYKGILKVEYNRHDKTYYYVDGHDFKIEKVQV